MGWTTPGRPGSSYGRGDDEDATLVKALHKVCQKELGVNTIDTVNAKACLPEKLVNQIIAKSKSVKQVRFTELGAMGFGMATHLLKSNFNAHAYDLFGLLWEADAAVSVLSEMDAWIICPFFQQGGWFTFEDVHYVADSDRTVILKESCCAGSFLQGRQFAKDASFLAINPQTSWVEEKTRGRIPASIVAYQREIMYLDFGLYLSLDHYWLNKIPMELGPLAEPTHKETLLGNGTLDLRHLEKKSGNLNFIMRKRILSPKLDESC
ncbi:hypothetical protein LguiB_035673 [Lonicera macranthoides]